MKKPKANITLTAAAEMKRGRLWLGVKKGLCELRRPRGEKSRPVPLPFGKGEKKLSLILCTAGICPGLSRAVESVQNQTGPREEWEILIVWNAPTPPPKQDYPQEIRWVWEQTPGISHARNAGAAAAKGEILLYIDDDARAEEHLAEIMIKTFRNHPDTAVVGGQIFLELPTPRPSVVLPGKEGLWSAYRVPYTGFRQVKEQYAFPYGACFALRKSVWEELGGFPTQYGRVGEDFGGGEETALCFLALQRGWKIGIQPKAKVEHHVEERRFTKEHVARTIRAGIHTTHRLCREGYAPKGWDVRYVRSRTEIARQEWEQLQKTGTELEQFYKECEKNALAELLEKMEGEG